MTDWDLPVEERLQRACEQHLEACYEAMWDWEEGEGDCTSPAIAPFCGCTTCVVREVLWAGWKTLAEAMAPSDASAIVPPTAGAPQGV